MRKSPWVFIAIAALVLIATPASADVIIHFVSGKTLPVRAVKYVDDMVQVDLGSDGMISFPRASIEKVEVPERVVNVGRNTAIGGKRSGPMIAGATEKGGKRETSALSKPKPATRNPGLNAQTRQQIDKNGFAVTNAVPMARGYAASRLKTVVRPDPHAARNNNAASVNGLRGTHFAGGRHVMASDQVPDRPKAVGIRLAGDAAPAVEDPAAEDPAPRK